MELLTINMMKKMRAMMMMMAVMGMGRCLDGVILANGNEEEVELEENPRVVERSRCQIEGETSKGRQIGRRDNNEGRIGVKSVGETAKGVKSAVETAMKNGVGVKSKERRRNRRQINQRDGDEREGVKSKGRQRRRQIDQRDGRKKTRNGTTAQFTREGAS